ncbi:hypothetical protein Q427_22275 [Halomonas sp. BC04]|nr:hypothetical protein Q427_22275 [Halomonas sp. BC04]
MGPDRDLDAFDGVHYQQAELTIENVEVQHIVQGGAGAQLVRLVIGLEGQPIGAQPVVVEMAQVVESTLAVRHRQPPLDEPIELVIEAQRGFVELHDRPPEKSNPPRCASERGVGGVVTSEYKTAGRRLPSQVLPITPPLPPRYA